MLRNPQLYSISAGKGVDQNFIFSVFCTKSIPGGKKCRFWIPGGIVYMGTGLVEDGHKSKCLVGV